MVIAMIPVIGEHTMHYSIIGAVLSLVTNRYITYYNVGKHNK